MNRYRAYLKVAVLLLVIAGRGAAAGEMPAGFAEGAELFEAGDHSAALEFFKATPRESGGAWVDYYLGRIHLQQNEIDLAIDRLSAATEADAESSLFHLWLGEAYVQKIDTVGMLKKLGVAKNARTNFEKAVELSPSDFEAREALTGYFLNAPAIAGGGHDKAEEQVAEFSKLDPAGGRRLQARILFNEEDWTAAVREYRLAIEAGDESPANYYRLGFALQQMEDYAAAIAAFESAIEVDEQILDAYYQIGRTAIFSGTHLDRAVECLTFYFGQPQQRGSPGIEHAHWRLGMVYELQNKDDLAAVEYRAALEIDPQHEEAKKALKALGKS